MSGKNVERPTERRARVPALIEHKFRGLQTVTRSIYRTYGYLRLLSANLRYFDIASSELFRLVPARTMTCGDGDVFRSIRTGKANRDYDDVASKSCARVPELYYDRVQGVEISLV